MSLINSIIVHSLADMLAVLEKQPDMAMQSAPHAAQYAGVLYLKTMRDEAASAYADVNFTFIVDCGDDPAVALSALQIGLSPVLFSGDAHYRPQLESLAAQLGATMLGD